jgi:hypothetical protein
MRHIQAARTVRLLWYGPRGGAVGGTASGGSTAVVTLGVAVTLHRPNTCEAGMLCFSYDTEPLYVHCLDSSMTVVPCQVAMIMCHGGTLTGTADWHVQHAAASRRLSTGCGCWRFRICWYTRQCSRKPPNVLLAFSICS